MEEIKFYCQKDGCKNEILEPKRCCSGVYCGCYGQPIDPPFCSTKCYEDYMKIPQGTGFIVLDL